MAKGKYRDKRLKDEQQAAETEPVQSAAGEMTEEAEETQQAPDIARTAPVGHDENANPLRRLVDLDFEKQAAQDAAGQEENTYGVWGPIWKFMRWYDAKRVPHTFKKKTYLLFMLFTGWAGGHRWYQGRRIMGLIETCLFWTGIPAIMMVTDFMEVWPIKPDENGYITMK